MPRSPKDNENIRAARREEIFRAAGRVFAKKGFAATKIADIAAEANLSHGLLYHYYRSKEEVYSALFEEILSKRPLMDESIASLPTAIERLERRIVFWLEKGAERPELTVLVTQALVADTLPPPARMTFLHYARTSYEAMLEDIRQAQADGDVFTDVSAEELSTAVMSMVRGLSTMRFIRASAFDGVSADVPHDLSVVTPETVMRVLRGARAPAAQAAARAPESSTAPQCNPSKARASKNDVSADAPAPKPKKKTKEKSRAA